MTKFLTAAAWSALVLGGAAVADTPPAEAEVATEAATELTTLEGVADEASVEITAAEAETEDDAEISGDDMAEVTEIETEEVEAAATDTE